MKDKFGQAINNVDRLKYCFNFKCQKKTFRYVWKTFQALKYHDGSENDGSEVHKFLSTNTSGVGAFLRFSSQNFFINASSILSLFYNNEAVVHS